MIPAVGAYGAREAIGWAYQAAELGAPAVMALPPNSYRADERAVVEHYRAVASIGLPVIAYNNPLDTKVDLVPELLARLFEEGLIVAVKEFAGDPRRAYAIRELAPELDVLIGSDDTLLEVALAGAKGWISGYTSAFPRSCIELYQASIAGDVATAVPLYQALHPLLRWDSRTEFVQAIKLSMDLVGRAGGPCRPPRLALSADHAADGSPADRGGDRRRHAVSTTARVDYSSARPTQSPRMCLMCEVITLRVSETSRACIASSSA